MILTKSFFPDGCYQLRQDALRVFDDLLLDADGVGRQPSKRRRVEGHDQVLESE